MDHKTAKVERGCGGVVVETIRVDQIACKSLI